MRLATARDELEPLRNPTVSGPDDPRLTILILSRVVTKLGDLEMITSSEIEELFAADLAFLQDFYGVINFGTQEEYESLLAAQAQNEPLGSAAASSADADAASEATDGQSNDDDVSAPARAEPPAPVRARVEEIPRRTE